jgi:hypothetical protein
MVIRAAKAAEKTRRRGCFMAMSAAIKNVLSPISENRIMVKERTKECRGWIRPADSSDIVVDGELGLEVTGGGFFIVGGSGCAMS